MLDRKDPDLDREVPTAKKIDELYKLIEGIETAMFTTRRADGHLVSRAMATQAREKGADLWFMTNVESHKLDELEADPHVNVSYYNSSSREWVSVSGIATVTRDREIIREYYKPDWKAWLGDEGGKRDGGPSDPRIALILVDAHSVVYLKVNKPKPVVLFEVVKAMITGMPPKVGDLREITERELHRESVRDNQ